MASGSFTEKSLQVNLTLASGQFGANLGNTKIVAGLRVNCEIRKMSQPSKNEAVVKIYGMKTEDMNQLSTLSIDPMAVRKNFIQVLAGDSDGLATAYQGEITGAWVSYHTPPDLFFEIHAVEGYYPSVAPVNPISLPGGVPVSTIFQNLAGQMGYTLQNNGVTTYIQNPYLYGSAMQQAQMLAKAANIEWGVDDGILYICPLGQPRPPKGQVPVIAPTTGMKEYPMWTKKGVEVETLYNPAFQLNGTAVIEGSIVTRANGVWRIHGLEHRLAAKHPGEGHWHSKLYLAKVGA